MEFQQNQKSAKMYNNIIIRLIIRNSYITRSESNKFVQSNLGRGPRRGTVAHVRPKIPIGYNAVPQIRSQKYLFPWTDPQTPLPASSYPGPVRPMMLNGIRIRFVVFLQCTEQADAPTHVRTYAQTDRSSAGKFDHCEPLHYESDAA